MLAESAWLIFIFTLSVILKCISSRCCWSWSYTFFSYLQSRYLTIQTVSLLSNKIQTDFNTKETKKIRTTEKLFHCGFKQQEGTQVIQWLFVLKISILVMKKIHIQYINILKSCDCQMPTGEDQWSRDVVLVIVKDRRTWHYNIMLLWIIFIHSVA